MQNETSILINDQDLKIGTKVLIKKEMPRIITAYFEELLEDDSNQEKSKIVRYTEIVNLMKEENITSEFHSFSIKYYNQSFSIVFEINLKIEKKFLLSNNLFFSGEILIDFSYKKVIFDLKNIKLSYLISNETVAYMDFGNITYSIDFYHFITTQESNYINLINSFDYIRDQILKL